MPRDPRPVLQLDTFDCATACLRYVLNCHGGDAELAQLRALAGPDNRGTNLLQLRAMAAGVGLRARFFRAQGRVESLNEDTPWIAQLRAREDGVAHFVVVRRIAGDRVHVMDPATGHVALPRADFERDWTRVLIQFTDEGVTPRARHDLRWIIGYALHGHRLRALAVSLAGAAVMALFGIVAAYVAQHLVNAVTTSPFRGVFWAALAAFFAFTVVQYVTGSGLGLAVQLLTARQVVRSSRDIASRFDALRWDYVSRLRHGDIVNRLRDPGVIEEFLIVECGRLAATILSFLIGFVWISARYPQLLPAVLIAIALAVLNFRLHSHALTSLSYRQKYTQVGMESLLIDYARCQEVMTARNGGAVLLAPYAERLAEYSRLHVRRVSRLAVMGFVATLCPLIVMGWSVWLLWRSGTTDPARVGDLVFQLTATGFIFGSINSSLDLLAGMDTLRVSFDRVADILTSPRRDRTVRRAVGERPVRRLVLDDFGYRAGPQQRSVSWYVERTDLRRPLLVALIGANGAGKSSLLRTLAGVADSDGGRLLLGSTAFTDAAHRRSATSYLPQTDQLFTGTVLSNILLGREVQDVPGLAEVTAPVLQVAPDVPVVEALAEVHVFNGGENLSGGQARRVAIARAITHDAPLLLLDEPFSSIDRPSIHEMLNLFETLPHDIIIIATHDDEVVARADAVLDLTPEWQWGQSEGRVGRHRMSLVREGA